MTEKTRKLALNTLNEIKDEMAAREETRYLMAMIMAINALESPRPDWTPCAEGLPKEYGEYWVTVDPCNAVVGNQPIRAYKCQFSKELGWETERFYHNVIAWMPTENQPDPYNPDHIRDTTKKVDQFREPTKMMQED